MGIVIFHVQGINQLALAKWPMFLLSQLGMGVPFFFMLSSFSILYSLRNITLSQSAIRNYFLRRFFRLAPLYYCMILVYCVFYYCNFKTIVTLQEVILNLTFSFSFSTYNYQGIVWAGWSIGIEFLMYLILPVFFSLASDVKSGLLLCILCLIFGTLFSNQYSKVSYVNSSYNYMNLMVMLPFFAIGIFAFRLFERNIFSGYKVIQLFLFNLLILLILLYCSYTIISKNSGIIYKYLSNYRLLFYSWAVFLLFVLIMQLYTPVKLLHNSFFAFLGKISYSIYLVHPLLIYFLKAPYAFLYSHINSSSFAFLLSFLMTCLILIPLSYLAYRFIETPGINLGKSVIRKFQSGIIPVGKSPASLIQEHEHVKNEQ